MFGLNMHKHLIIQLFIIQIYFVYLLIITFKIFNCNIFLNDIENIQYNNII